MTTSRQEIHLLSARLVSVLIFILLIPAGITAARSLAAEVIAYPAVRQLQLARERMVGLPAWHWQEIMARLQRARSFAPENPVLLHQLGDARMLQYRYVSATDDKAMAARRQAVEYYREAIALRPTWPHERIDFLLARFRLQDIDPAFYQQLLLANRLGPWEAWVQRTTAEIGLRLDEQMPAEIRQAVRESIANGARHPDGNKQMLEMLRRYNSLEMVCGKVTDENVTEYCDRHL